MIIGIHHDARLGKSVRDSGLRSNQHVRPAVDLDRDRVGQVDVDIRARQRNPLAATRRDHRTGRAQARLA